MGAQSSKDAAEAEEGIIFVHTEAAKQSQSASSAVLAELAAIQQLTPILKESLSDNTWKDLEALPKTNTETFFSPDATLDVVEQCKEIYSAAARLVSQQQDRVVIKLQQAESATSTLTDQLKRFANDTKAANQKLGTVDRLGHKLEELQARVQRLAARHTALSATLDAPPWQQQQQQTEQLAPGD